MTSGLEMVRLRIDGLAYAVEIFRQRKADRSGPRLLMVAYQPNEQAQHIVRVAIEAIKKYTPEEYELWVIDNASPRQQGDWLREVPDINMVLNRTTPLPPEARGIGSLVRRWHGQPQWASYAHGAGLEIGWRVVDQNCKYIMPLDMDVMPCRSNWLSYLVSKIDASTKAAGMRFHPGRGDSGTLHSMAYLVDFQLFKQLKVDFFPDFPLLDDGDKTTVKLEADGYEVFAARNTVLDETLVSELKPRDAIFRKLHVDRAFDDEGNVVFLHLGRGVRKSKYSRHTGTSTKEWLEFAQKFVLNEREAISRPV
jgi:hypothetical protein